MKKLQIAIIAISVAGAMSVSASFGPLPGATFGGSGIPNDAVEVTTITTAGGDTITLGLTATPRYPSSPSELGNNGNGTFYAPAGMQWNFDYYVNVAGSGNVSDYSFLLGYALVPGTPTASLGSFNLSAAYSAQSPTIPIQDSQYPGFGYLTAGVAGVVTPPAGAYAGPYNINAIGDYQFVLNAYSGSTLIGQSDITVAVVPEPTTMLAGALLLLPFGASTLRIRRKGRAA